MTKQHTYFKIDKWGVHFNDWAFCIFSVMAGLIVGILFVLLFVYNAV